MKKQLGWIMKHLAFNMHQSLELSKSPRSEMQGEQCGIGRSRTGQGDPAPQCSRTNMCPISSSVQLHSLRVSFLNSHSLR